MAHSPTPEQWKREAKSVFEAAVSEYAGERETQPWYQTQVRFALDALAGERGRVLDLGCAAGVEIGILRNAGFGVVGVDFAEQMLLAARRRFGGNGIVHLARADAESLPFASATFDHVVCLGVLEYLASYSRSLAEVRRVLRPGGVAVFAAPSRISLYHLTDVATQWTLAPLWRAAKRAAGRASAGSVPPHHRNLCIPGRFLRQLAELGLEPVDHAHTAFVIAPLQRFWPAAGERLAIALERFGRSRSLGWMGSQFIVAARKTP